MNEFTFPQDEIFYVEGEGTEYTPDTDYYMEFVLDDIDDGDNRCVLIGECDDTFAIYERVYDQLYIAVKPYSKRWLDVIYSSYDLQELHAMTDYYERFGL